MIPHGNDAPEPSHASAEDGAENSDPQAGVTLRAVAIGFAVSVPVAVLNSCIELVWGVE